MQAGRAVRDLSLIHILRSDVKKALEIARTDKVIGASLEAELVLYCDGELYDFLNTVKDLDDLFIVSKTTLCKQGTGAFTGEVAGLSIDAKKAGEMCIRDSYNVDIMGDLLDELESSGVFY